MRSAAVDLGAQPIRNLNPTPRAGTGGAWGVAYGTGGAGTNTNFSTGGPDGGSFKRMEVTTAPSAGSFRMQAGATLGQVGNTPIAPNRVYTTSYWVRLNQAASIRVHMDWLTSSSVYVTTTLGTPVAVPANTWTRVSATLTVPNNASIALALPYVLFNSPLAEVVVGTQLDGANSMTTEGVDLKPYADPTYPGWRWTSTGNNSESVGWPYTLESIAGTPSLWLDAARINGTGAAQPANGAAIAQWSDVSGRGKHFSQATAGNRPTYRAANPAVVFSGGDKYLDSVDVDIASTVQTYYGVYSVQANPPGGVVVLINQANTLAPLYVSATAPIFFAAFRTPSGTPNPSVAKDGTVHVHATRFGATQVGHQIDNVAEATVNNSAVAALTGSSGQWRLGVDMAVQRDVNPGEVRELLIFPTEHNATTMARVIAWLARKNGTPIPAGY